ncbi:MAG: sulfite exporter TauE/SafE family protein [Desulfovibrio sp.]|nr:sulfite exporter TauE/SafE family protein [Desulfovibrio sp.]MBI4961072.1 sulfite exporter TauE/SafE family protein [Desulfovibrio sp.]
MLEPSGYIGLIALGFGAGAFGTLIGAGGGFVLMPLLLVLYPDDPPALLTSISLAAVFFNALSGTEAYAMARRIDYRSALLFSCATLPGAILGALNTSSIPRRTFDIVFGLAVLAAAAFLSFKKPGRACDGKSCSSHQTSRSITDAHGTSWTYSFNPVLGTGLSLLVGYLSSFLGIGGGIMHVPLMVYLLNFPVHVATATAQFILAVMSLSGTLTHVMTGAFSHGAHRTAALAIGMVVGAQVGAKLSDRIGGTAIVRLLAGGLAVLGIRILLLALGWWK